MTLLLWYLFLTLCTTTVSAIGTEDWIPIGQPLPAESARIAKLTGHRMVLEHEETLQVWEEEATNGNWTLIVGEDEIDADSLAFYQISGNGQRIVMGARSRSRFFPFPHVRVHLWNGESLGVYVWAMEVSHVDQMIVDINDDGNRVAVGYNPNSYGRSDVQDFFGQGTVELFDWNPVKETWFPVGNPIRDSAAWYFGKEIKLSGDGTTVVVSASYNNTPADTPGFFVQETRRVYRFSEENQDWVQLGSTDLWDRYANKHFSGEKYGTREFSSISQDGTIVAIGTTCQVATVIYPDTPCFENQTSRVNVFSYDSIADDWSVLGQEITSDQQDEFGHVDLLVQGKDVYLVVGARAYKEERGRVALYRYQEGEWVTYVDEGLFGTQPGERLGNVVGLAAQNRLLVAGTDTARVWQYAGNIVPVDVAQLEGSLGKNVLTSSARKGSIYASMLLTSALFSTFFEGPRF